MASDGGDAACLLLTLGLISVLAGCKESSPGVACMPPQNPTCSGAAPSFSADVNPNVFMAFCVTCHSPSGVEPSMPLTTYQQIYGVNGQEATEIFTQVFENCMMPPSNAPAPLTDGDGGDALGARQTLLDWLVCGAPNN
jgi:hypothetical protein